MKPQKAFVREKNKRYLKKFRIYPAFLYNRLDKWLKSMSLKGWRLVRCGIFSFLFESSEIKEREYFTYDATKREGKYSLSMRHPFLEEKYGIKKKKSKINAQERKPYLIVEIDTQKIDIQNDVGYKELLADRKRLSLLYFLRNVGLFILSVIIIILAINNL